MSIKFELPSNVDVFNATTLTSTTITSSALSATSSFTVNGFQIDLSGGATTNQVLQYNGSKFIAASVGSGVSGSFTSTKIPYATGSTTLADSGMTWDNSGKIFTVNTSSGGSLKVSDGTHIIQLFPDTTNNVGAIGTASNHDLTFFTNASSTQMRLSTSGQLAIGSTSPSYQLDVFGDARTSSRYIINQSTAAVSPSNMGAFRFNSSTSHIEFSENGGAWAQIVSATGAVSGSFTTGRLPYASSSTGLADSGVTWDNTNQLLGVGQTAPIARLDVSQTVASSGNPVAMRVLAAAHTTLTASTEVVDVYLNLARTVQINSGALATERAVLITAPTYAFTASSTITTAATFTVSDAPQSGTNATITKAYSIWAQNGVAAFDGHIKVDGYLIDLSGGATTNQVLTYNGTKFTASTSGGNISGTLTSTKIPYATGSTALSDTNIAWDSSNKIATVTTNTSTAGLKVTDGTRTVALALDSTSSSGQVGTTSNHNLTFFTNSSSAQMTLNTSGQLGIGGSASFPLHVVGDGYFTSRSIYAASSASVSPSNTGAIRYNTSTSHLEFSENAGSWTQFGAGGGGGMSIGGTVTSGTSKSILYVDGSSNLAQDNSNFAWDFTNHRLGVGTSSPDRVVDIRATGSNPVLSIQHSSSSSYSAIDFFDDTRSFKMAFGYANASSGDATSAGRGYWYADSGIDRAITYYSGVTNSNVMIFLKNSNGYIGIGNTSPAAQLDQTQVVATTGSPIGKRFVGAAHTTLTASTEAMDGYYKLDRTVQFSTGALTTQRAMYISAPTYAFSGSSTLTNAATFAIGNAPTAGTNATITNAYALWVQAGNSRFDGGINIGNSSAAVSPASSGTMRYNSTAQHFEISENGGSYKNFMTIGSTVGSGTSGSIPYIDSSTNLAQDNSNLFWDASNHSLGIGTSSPGAEKLYVQSSLTTGSTAAIRNTSSTGYSTIVFIDSSNTEKGAIGVANASASATNVAGKMYMGSPGDMVITTYDPTTIVTFFNSGKNVNIGTTTSDPGVKLNIESASTSAGIALGAGASLSVSNSSTGRIRYNSSTQHFEISENGGAYTQMATGSGGSIGGSVSSNQVAYGSGSNTIQGSSALTYDGTTLTVAQHINVDGYLIDISAGATDGQALVYNASANKFKASTVSGGGGGFGTSGQKMISIVPAGFNSNNGTTTPQTVTAFRYNPSDYTITSTTQSVVFRAVAANGSATVTGHIKLRDITNSVDITTLNISAGTTTDTVFEQTLTVSSAGSNTIANSAVIYEVRIYVDSPVNVNDFVQLYSAELRNIQTIN